MRRLVLALGVVVLAAAGNAITPESAQAAGNWEDVCCGTACGEQGPYCLGSGTYTCCKSEDPEG